MPHSGSETLHRWIVQEFALGRGRLRHASQVQTHPFEGGDQQSDDAEVQWYSCAIHEGGDVWVVKLDVYKLYFYDCVQGITNLYLRHSF